MARFRCAWCNKEYPKSQAKWRTTDTDNPQCTKRYCVACARKGDHRRVICSRLLELPPDILHRAKYDHESDDFIYAGCDVARVARIKRQRDELKKQGILYRPAEYAHDHNFTKEGKRPPRTPDGNIGFNIKESRGFKAMPRESRQKKKNDKNNSSTTHGSAKPSENAKLLSLAGVKNTKGSRIVTEVKKTAKGILKAEEDRAKKEALEKAFYVQILGARLPTPTQQFAFHPERKWRFDFAWPDRKIAFEVQGGIYTKGGHTRAKGYNNDCEKANEARLLGWQVYAITTDHISSGQALKWVERALTPTV